MGGGEREKERFLLGENVMELHTQINLWLFFNHRNTAALVYQITDVQFSPSRC